ncbi:MAG: hypothetical protein HKN76_21220, partial [Saprospiraceae bacterium]|nr:hypothetical protein [Saprospiraceae bacterium]
NRYGAGAAVFVAFVLYYILNYSDTGELTLVYRWTPEPFGWAMLAGFITLTVVSKLTPDEPVEAVAAFFKKMHTHSDQVPGQPEIVDKELMLLDVGTWFKRSHWSQFSKRFKTDFFGFMLAWLFVAVLILIAWLILQIK